MLSTIKEYDEVTGTLIVVATPMLDWVDHRLTWSPEAYGGVTRLQVPLKYVWRPNLVLTNPADVVKEIGSDIAIAAVRVFSDGHMYWMPADIFRALCPADVTYYPFDAQTCQINISAYGQFVYELNFTSTMDSVFRPVFTENGEWELRSTFAESLVDHYVSWNIFTLQIYRRPLYFVINILIPVVFLGFLNIIVFLIPAESGERISYSITVMLAITVFLSSVADTMPKTSHPMSLLCYYLLSCMALSVFISLTSIIIVRTCHRTDKVPVYWTTFLCYKRMHKNTMIVHVHPVDESDQEKKDIESKPDVSYGVETEGDGAIRGVTEHSEGRRNIPRGDGVFREEKAESSPNWKDVSRTMNTVLGWISVMFWLVATIVFFVTVTIPRR